MAQYHQGILLTTVFCKGPFELTKVSSQVSVVMAQGNNTAGSDDPIRKSYARLGTIATFRNIVKNRGVLGLYSGYRLHLSKLYFLFWLHFLGVPHDWPPLKRRHHLPCIEDVEGSLLLLCFHLMETFHSFVHIHLPSPSLPTPSFLPPFL
jgi:Mitochondrial carrier protein